MSYLYKKLLSFMSHEKSESKLSLIDTMILGSFLIGAAGLGLIWLLI